MKCVLILIVLVQTASACDQTSTADNDWYKTAAFYQIYPRSFQDSNGDGLGDLNGITTRLSYLASIGIKGIWLSPIFASPMVDFGYDISDFYSIQPEYGTMVEFEYLLSIATRLGLKILLDFVPNHTSDQHEWFVSSASTNTSSLYRDFYVWHPGYVNPDNVNGARLPPSNWLSVFGGSAWTWHEIRQEFYYHQFGVTQPDLNFRNANVVQALKEVLMFWLKKGVAGFRIDAVPHIFEVATSSNGSLPNEPLSGTTDDQTSWNYLTHTYTVDQPDTIDLVYQWRKVLDDHQLANGGDERIMMLESYSPISIIVKLFGNGTVNGAQVPFNFQLLSMQRTSTAADYANAILYWMDNMPAGRSANWVIGNHDNARVATRLGVERIDLINLLLLTLPGSSVTYYGEEIGMTNVATLVSETTDTTRDPERTPFQWDDTVSAGFSRNSNTWLPLAANYTRVNVKAQLESDRSHLKCYMAAMQLRRSETLKHGSLQVKTINGVLVLMRSLSGQPSYVTMANIGDITETVDLYSLFSTLPSFAEFVIVSVESFHQAGALVSTTEISLRAGESVVLKATVTASSRSDYTDL